MKMTTFAAVSAFSSNYCKIPTHSWLEILFYKLLLATVFKNFNQQESNFYGGVCCTSIVVIGHKQLHVACTYALYPTTRCCCTTKPVACLSYTEKCFAYMQGLMWLLHVRTYISHELLRMQVLAGVIILFSYSDYDLCSNYLEKQVYIYTRCATCKTSLSIHVSALCMNSK